MVTIDQIENGLTTFLDKNLMPMFDDSGWQKLVIGTGIAMAIRHNRHKVDELRENQYVKMIGIFDEDGMVDLEALKDEVKKRMPDKGINIDIPMVGQITFKKSDIETLCECIEEA